MLNKEKYAKEILDIVCGGHSIAKQNGHLQPCSRTVCSKCDFNTNLDCSEEMRKWANSEYKEREIDWNKVPVDTPIYVFGMIMIVKLIKDMMIMIVKLIKDILQDMIK